MRGELCQAKLNVTLIHSFVNKGLTLNTLVVTL